MKDDEIPEDYYLKYPEGDFKPVYMDQGTVPTERINFKKFSILNENEQTTASDNTMKPEEKNMKTDNEGWILSREKMPDFDGEYLIAGYLYHECGNITKFQKVVTCRFNQWVRDDIGEQMTYWRPLLPFPKETDQEKENLKSYTP